MSYVGRFALNSWSGALPFYSFKCEKHGMVVNYPSSHDEHLKCPLCLWEDSHGGVEIK